MTSPLYDPVIERAISVAKKGRKATPTVAAPTRLVPLLSFSSLPERAKVTVLDVLDTDDGFRERVANGVTEAKHGRFTYSYLARPDGWETYIANVLEVADEPVIVPSVDIEDLEGKLAAATSAREAAEDDARAAREALATTKDELTEMGDRHAELSSAIVKLTNEVETLKAQRQQAVSELKTTESVMARHIAARKQLETTIEQMTSAQLSTTTVGGSITDAEVRVGLDAIDFTIGELREQLDNLRRAATPERIEVSRRVALAPPLGLADDATEFAEYLLAIPNVVVFVDGYNVTKTEVPELELTAQRSWLERVITDYLARISGRFEVVFDGADVAGGHPNAHDRLRVRFSPSGVEADDVIIAAVRATDSRRPVVVVSSDKRVQEGARAGGANVLSSRQFIAACHRP